MSDPAQAYLATKAADPWLDDYNAQIADARKRDQGDPSMAGAYLERVKALGGEIADNAVPAVNRTLDTLMNLPRNAGVGVWKAALNTANTLSDVGGKAMELVGADPQPTLAEEYPDFWKAANDFADTASYIRSDGPFGIKIEGGGKVEDDLTQGVAQFAVPFGGWLKAVNGLKVASPLVKGLIAEGATTATAYQPHDARVADLVQMGRSLDNRFGNVLRQLSPDGSLANKYIDWMTNRKGEGEWEGRFKNAVDSLVPTAVIAGLVKAAGSARRSAQAILDNPPKPKPAKTKPAAGGA